jgi:hypothetical protein
MKIRVFELARAKNISIGQVVELLAQKGIHNASAITYVEPDILDDVVQSNTAQQQAAPEENPPRPAMPPRKPVEDRWRNEPKVAERESPLALVTLGLSIVALIMVALLFFSERSDRSEMKDLTAEVNLLKAGNAKVEDMVINNRAQILDVRDQLTGIEKRFYEFKRSSLVSQLKSQGVVIRALSENMKEPMKNKALSLANHLSTF